MRLTLSIGLLIALTILFLFISLYQREKEQRLAQINTQAEALISEMLVAREWVSSYNGVWTSEPGDYYLKSVNGYYQKSPAMVTKELSNLSEDKGYYRFHITSLILMNPDNAPDNFEHDALLQFDKMPEPITTIDRSGEEPVYRLMIPLKVEESCLKCHADQGYKTGDVRGGLSVLVPISEMDASLAKSRKILVVSAFGSISLIVIALYILVKRMVISPVGELKKVALAVSEGNYEARCHLNTGDELEVFGKTLNQMLSKLKKSQDFLKERVIHRTQELDTISEIALIISRAGELDKVLNEALEKIVAITEAKGGLIQLFEQDKFRVAAHKSLDPSFVQCFRYTAYENINKEIPHTQKSIRVGEITEKKFSKILSKPQCQENNQPVITKNYTHFASLLLKSRQRTLGTIILLSENKESFSSEIMQLLESIGNQLGVAIENAFFHQRVEQIAILEERERISRELHDSLAQTLGWLSIKTELLEEDLNLGKIEESKVEMKAIRRVTRDACYDVRESIDGLRTRPTGNLTLTATAWIAEFRQRSGIITEFHATDNELHLDPILESELLRILQEALTNVRKHAQAKHVQIHLKTKDSFVELIIKDDGKGFIYNANQNNRHFGLRIMRERAERLNGKFEIKSTIDVGTKIKILLPLYPSQ